MTTGGDASRAKAAGAWTAEQTVSFMLDRLAAGHFVRVLHITASSR
jgi:hypothetical protein